MFKPTPELTLRLLWLGGRRGLTWRWASMGRLLATLLALASQAAGACTAEDGPSIADLIENGASVAISTAVQITGPERPVGLEESRQSEIQVAFLDDHKVSATVRIVEALVGDTPELEKIAYYPIFCGGHRFDAGRYYVLAVAPHMKTMELELGSSALLGLGEEYSEEIGARRSDSALLKALLAYRENGELDISPSMLLNYREITRQRYEWPSSAR